MRSLDLACLRDEPAQQSGDRDHEVYGNNPGQHGDWDLKQQCQMLMMDTNAYPDHSMADMPDICYSIKCRAPGRRGYYRAGPALEGTPCGTDKVKIFAVIKYLAWPLSLCPDLPRGRVCAEHDQRGGEHRGGVV